MRTLYYQPFLFQNMQNSQLQPTLAKHIKDDLSPQKEERDYISEKYAQLAKFVGGTTIQSGSYARFTSTIPVNDLDVIWIMPEQYVNEYAIRSSSGQINPQHVDPSHILSSLARNLEALYKDAGTYARIRTQSHSIGLYFGENDEEFSMDIVPAIISGENNAYGEDTYWVPHIAKYSKTKRASVYDEQKPIDWIKSDPRGYITDAKELNDSNPNFRKVAKLVRKWRRGCKSIDSTFPLKSFHLELIINDIFCETESLEIFEAVKIFFTKLPYYLQEPSFADRANPSIYVDSYISSITDRERAKITVQINKVHTLLSALENETEVDKILYLTKQILSGVLSSNELSVVNTPASLISLGDFSHQRPLGSVGITDQPSYPCQVKLKAEIFFRGPQDKTINRRSRGFFKSGSLIPTHCEIDFTAKTDAPVPYKVYWQVVNTGEHAQSVGGTRGSIIEGSLKNTELSLYTGMHWIECFIVTQEGVCIARSGRFYVRFLNPNFPPQLETSPLRKIQYVS